MTTRTALLTAAGVAAVLAVLLWGDGQRRRGDAPSAGAAANATDDGAGAVALEAPGPRLTFRDDAPGAGLNVPHVDAADGRFRLVETMGSGVGLIDFDRDGWLDIFVGQGAEIPADPSDRSAAQLYRNNRDGTFTDVAGRAGVAFRGFAQGVAVGDYDRDGDDDLYVAGFNRAALYRNEGDGTFREMTEAAGLHGRGWASSCAFADLDGDGDLDLFVVRYLANTVDDQGRPTVDCNALPGRIGYCPPLAFAPEPDALYRNNGDGTFTDVADAAGIRDADGNGLGLAIADLDDDGLLDVFVANDKTPHRLHRNLGGLRFEEVGLPWGVAYNEAGEPTAGMGVAAGDHDGDGRTDLLVTNFYEEGATLYRNVAPGHFEVVTARARLRAPTRGTLGFGVGFLDADNDGWLDLFIANGHVNDVSPLGMPYRMPPQLFRNLGSGRYAETSATAGAYFEGRWLGRAVALGDLDNDGATDLVVTHNDGPPALLRNTTTPRGHALRLSLAGAVRGRPGVGDAHPIGARVRVEAGGRSRSHEVVGGTSYLAAHDPRLLIGLGDRESAERVEVRWPSGKVETWEGVPAETPWRLVEGEAPRLRPVSDDSR